MKVPKLLIPSAVLIASFAFGAETPQAPTTKPSSNRWQIIQAVSGTSYEAKPGNRAENTILLDTETGKTWILWPTEDTPSGYSWIEVTQKPEASKKK